MTTVWPVWPGACLMSILDTPKSKKIHINKWHSIISVTMCPKQGSFFAHQRCGHLRIWNSFGLCSQVCCYNGWGMWPLNYSYDCGTGFFSGMVIFQQFCPSQWKFTYILYKDFCLFFNRQPGWKNGTRFWYWQAGTPVSGYLAQAYITMLTLKKKLKILNFWI